MTGTSSETAALLHFARLLRFDDLPTAIVAESKRNILDFLGVTIGSIDQPAAHLAAEQVRQLGGHPQATVPVSGLHTNTTNAAFLLGVMGHVLDFDDTHMPTILHGTTPVVAAALPLTQWLGRSGRDLITAYVSGFETAARVALALHPSHYDMGWHVTSTSGTIGAAVAASRLLNLTAAQYAFAVGLAATQAAGHRDHFGTMAKSFGVGKAATNGVLGALLATRGFDASSDGLQGRRGMFAVMAHSAEPRTLDNDLGERWELLNSGLKPYPCGVVSHPAIDLALRIRDAHATADLLRIDTHVHPLVMELTNKNQPQTPLEGKFSVGFAMAVALLEGGVRPSHFSSDYLGRDQVLRVADLINLVPDDSLSEAQANATLHLVDGNHVRYEVTHASGMAGNPLSTTQVRAKFHGLVDPVLGDSVADEIADLVDRLDELPTIDALISKTLKQPSNQKVGE